MVEWKLRERIDDTATQLVRLGRKLGKRLGGGMRGSYFFQSLEAHRSAFLAPRSCESGVDSDPVEPGEECGLAAVAVDVPPRLDKGVLHGFLDISRIGEDSKQDETETGLVPPDDLRERVEVALSRKLRELGIDPLAESHPEIVRS